MHIDDFTYIAHAQKRYNASEPCFQENTRYCRGILNH